MCVQNLCEVIKKSDMVVQSFQCLEVINYIIFQVVVCLLVLNFICAFNIIL
jgi:hypothetical protein